MRVTGVWKRAAPAIVLVVAAAASLSAGEVAVTPGEAIAAAVQQKVGPDAAVHVGGLHTRVEAEPGLVAVPEPNAKIARPSRFVLTVRGVRRGVATATVGVVARYPRAARLISRDEVIGLDTVDFTTGPMPPAPMQRPLTGPDIAGLNARRDIAEGEPLTATVLRVPKLVKSGDRVAVTVRIGVVEVVGEGIASGSGYEGDVVRVMQPHTTKVLKGRVTGPGAVEIVQ